jgi:hypothetical protein
MALLQQLVGFTLRQVIGDEAEDVGAAAVALGETAAVPASPVISKWRSSTIFTWASIRSRRGNGKR